MFREGVWAFSLVVGATLILPKRINFSGTQSTLSALIVVCMTWEYLSIRIDDSPDLSEAWTAYADILLCYIHRQSTNSSIRWYIAFLSIAVSLFLIISNYYNNYKDRVLA